MNEINNFGESTHHFTSDSNRRDGVIDNKRLARRQGVLFTLVFLLVALSLYSLDLKAQVEIIVDNTDPGAQPISGPWWTNSGGSGYEGTNFATSTNNVTNEFRWTPDLSGSAGEYDVYVKYSAGWWNLGVDVPYTVVHDNGSNLTRIDQTVNGGQWVLLDRYSLSQGGYVSVGADISDGKRPSADSVRFVQVSSNPPPPPLEEIIIDNTDSGAQAISGPWWTNSGGSGYEGTNFATSTNNVTNEFRWTPNLSGSAGEYDVYVKYSAGWWNLGVDVPYTVVHDNGSNLTRIDQTVNGGQWVLLGRYPLSQGGYVSVGADISDGKRPSADSVRLVKITATEEEERLNFVVILTDDQRPDTIDSMPILLNKIASRGVTFDRTFMSTPLCGPVRANLISGGFYAYNTGLISNPGDNGGEDKFRGQDSDTIATALQQAGYKTMFAGGKYLNGYAAPYIPPGWTRFVNNNRGPAAGEWFDFDVVTGNSGATASTGTTSRVTQYVTDYHRDQVIDFLDEVNGSDFFVYFSVFQPHAPAIPDTQDEGLFPDYLYRDRAWGETDLSDKPDWVSNPNRYIDQKLPRDEFQRDQLRSLQSIDRAIGAIVDKVEAMGELDRTVFIFTSDNGYLWGEHGLHTKGMAYDESIGVPFIIAAPGVLPGSSEKLVAADLDIGATIFDLANISKPSDGRSLAPLLNDPNAEWRNELYFQHWGGHEGAFGTWSAIRTDQWKYIENAYGEEELYDLTGDPYEEESQHNNPNFDFIRTELAAKLSANRGMGLRDFIAPSGNVGQNYSFTIDTWGGQAPFSWTIESGALPTGLSLNPSSGVVSGIPTASGTFTATITVEDSSIGRHSGQPQRIVGPGKGVNNYYTFTINP